MIQSSQTFRIFVSSTFSDLKAERNALQEKVFPKLRELCAQHGCRFQAIDLRWGVSEEAALDQQAMRICLEEVGRCQRLSPRPNFIILLGDRYGWQPAPYEIAASEYERIIQNVDSSEKIILNEWYRRDNNAVPPVYDLLPREGIYEDFNTWAPVERELLRILRKGIENLNLPESGRLKHWSSATEQEIYKGALNAPDAKQHVFCFLRSIEGIPQDKTAKDFIDLDENGQRDKEASARLSALKERLHHDLPGNVHEYTCQWTKNISTHVTRGDEWDNDHLYAAGDYLDKLCDDVYDDLSGIIKQELSTLKAIDPLEQEIEAHKNFALERARHFTGRKEIQEKILSYLNNSSRSPLAIHGEGGSGKSALMAQVFKRVSEEIPATVVISRFIGATPASTNIFSLLENICKQVAGAYGADDATPTEYKELVEEFKTKLTLASTEKPLIIILDALDQLSDAQNAKNLQWLPIELPENVKLVISVLEPNVCFDQLKIRLSAHHLLQLGRMEQYEGEALLDDWLSVAKRTLQEKQRAHLLERYRNCSVPLYMKLAFEEARTWKSYDIDKAEITGQDIQGVIMEFLNNLTAESRHGEVMVKHALGYLAAGKNGLTEEEMLGLLSLDEDVKEAFWRRSPNSPKPKETSEFRLPVVVWSRLYLDLKLYLMERAADQTAVMSFFHRQFGDVVRNNFLDPEKNKQLHCRIAEHLNSQPYEYPSQEDRVPNYRKVSEIAFQMMQGEMWQELQATITDFDYPMTKCKAEMLDDLLDDYQKANSSPVPDKQSMLIWAAFFRERAHILRRGNDEWPAYKILLQLAIEHADDSPLTQEAEKYLADEKCNWVWLRRERRIEHVGVDPCIAVLEGHLAPINGTLLLSDNRVMSWSVDGIIRIWDYSGKTLGILEGHTDFVEVKLLSDGRVLSWSWDKTLRLWNSDGRLLAVFEGHTADVRGVLLLPDGRILSWGGNIYESTNDNTLRLWSHEGKPLSVLEGHTDLITGALLLPDGRILSCSADKTLRLWDRDGKPLTVIDGHTDRIAGVSLLSGGMILSWALDKTLRLWNCDGNSLATLQGHSQVIEGFLQLPNDRILSWARTEKILLLWNLDEKYITEKKSKRNIFDFFGAKINSIKPAIVFEGHTDSVIGAMLLPDGHILSWSADKTLRLWDSEGKMLTVFEGHTDRVTGAMLLPDGHILSWSDDKTLRLWDSDGKMLNVFEGHTDSIGGAMLMPDGRILSWAHDATIRLWNPDGKQLPAFERHTDWAHNAVSVANGNILTWSRKDRALRLWDYNGKPLAKMNGHAEGVEGTLLFPDMRILSWSGDKTLRLWDRDGKPLVVLKGHTGPIEGALLRSDLRILSWSKDHTLRLWDPKSHNVLKGHTDSIRGALSLTDEKILSWSDDGTIRLWDSDGKPLAVLKGHTGAVSNTLVLPDGRILSYSDDKTLRLWNSDSKPLAVLEGHTQRIQGATLLPDGRILSCSTDGTLRLWNSDGKPLAVLKGHTGAVFSALVLSDGRILSWSGDGTRRLWDSDGKFLMVYNGIKSVRSFPEVRRDILGASNVCSHCGLYSWGDRVCLEVFDKNKNITLFWDGPVICEAEHLDSNGHAIANLADGQVCVMRIYHGNKLVLVSEFEKMIV